MKTPPLSSHFSKKFWLTVTGSIALFTLFIMGRNAVHAIRIKRQINVLHRQEETYRAKIAADSALLEQLRYDEYLEEYAREHFRMRRTDEHVYIVE
ncbi:MAG: septum formation initiator family protein [Alistipes sp.]|nr:septum formation initiator family protein [Alistipes senegalensis]MCM1249995.1 septum formation initiator family protein [Alistipes sp.]